MKRLFVLVILLLSLIVVGVSSAQQSTEDPKENACYDGGDLEGKCGVFKTEAETEWAWNCGHYYAQYVSGKISLEQAPETCHILFETITVSPLSLCIYLGEESRAVASGMYIWLQGFANNPGNSTLYYAEGGGRSTSPCDTLKPLGAPSIWMQTPAYVSYEEALAQCNAADPSEEWNDAYQLSDPALSNFNWYCTVMR